MKKNEAFTLIEILVWIAIIALILIWSTQLNFNYSNNKQKLEIFTNSVISEIERVRNNSLVWKWIDSDLTLPEKWKIDFVSWEWWDKWSITTSYTLSTEEIPLDSDWELENEFNIDNNFSIKNIYCTSDLDNNEVAAIIFEWWNYILEGECLTDKSLVITTSYQDTEKYSNEIKFSAISGLVKK